MNRKQSSKDSKLEKRTFCWQLAWQKKAWTSVTVTLSSATTWWATRSPLCNHVDVLGMQTDRLKASWMRERLHKYIQICVRIILCVISYFRCIPKYTYVIHRPGGLYKEKLCPRFWVRPKAAGRGPYSRPRAKFFPIRTDRGRWITCLFFSAILEVERGELVWELFVNSPSTCASSHDQSKVKIIKLTKKNR